MLRVSGYKARLEEKGPFAVRTYVRANLSFVT